MILPAGCSVWLAVAACPAVGRTAWSGDAVVVAAIPCSPCWQRLLGAGRWVTADDLDAAGAVCDAPVGVIAQTPDGARIPLLADDPTVIAIPTTAERRAA